MTPDFKDTVLNKHGYTDDICYDLVDTYERYRNKCTKFAEQFRRETLDETCHALFDFVIGNFRYKEDPMGVQMIKTPARLMYQKVGDCKSFTLFVNCMLYCLGYKPWFRFVSYADVDYQHVYTVLYEYGREVVIDTVAYIQKNIPLYSEMKYYKKKDMQSTKIIRMSGIGNPTGFFTNFTTEIKQIASALKGKTVSNGATVTDATANSNGSVDVELSNGTSSTLSVNQFMNIASTAAELINNIEIRDWSLQENPILNQLQSYIISNAEIRNDAKTDRLRWLSDMTKTSYVPLIVAGCFVLALAYFKSNGKSKKHHHR